MVVNKMGYLIIFSKTGGFTPRFREKNGFLQQEPLFQVLVNHVPFGEKEKRIGRPFPIRIGLVFSWEKKNAYRNRDRAKSDREKGDR